MRENPLHTLDRGRGDAQLMAAAPDKALIAIGEFQPDIVQHRAPSVIGLGEAVIERLYPVLKGAEKLACDVAGFQHLKVRVQL
uniref:Uncharacterized protein n=1 Tax=Aquisalinus luteolus TaxID=1566827 RepID=A0A8J3A4K7_9PROT|nr:hypothetical protein GCM10011355_34670 [Aquisalinus luteolus]